MATSGSTDFSATANDIIRGALRLIGVTEPGEAPSSSEASDALSALNMMVKSWQADGINLWRTSEGSLTLVQSQATYTMGGSGTPDFASRPLSILSMRRRVSGIDTPLQAWSRQLYFEQPNKATEAPPTAFYYDPGRSQGTLYLWPTPDATSTTLHFTYKRSIEDFDTLTNEPDFPTEWLACLKYNLAVEIAPEYGRDPSQLVLARAGEYRARLIAFDQEEASVYFEPDLR